MSATVHFVEFLPVGQRFACGDAATKWWAKTDAQGVLHVASGEKVRVTCPQCKDTAWYQADGDVGILRSPSNPEAARHAPDQRTDVVRGAEATVAPPATAHAASTDEAG